jgi:DNA repair protein RadC
MSDKQPTMIREVGLRTVKQLPALGTRVLSPADAFLVWQYVIERADWWDPQRETLCSLFTDIKGNVQGFHLAHLGGRSSASLDIPLTLRPAVLAGAARLFIFHNHPTGDTDPSPEDIASTRGLAEACHILEIQLIDHLIIGTKHANVWPWLSLRSQDGSLFSS